jgi:hypothetical protein
MKFFFKFLFGLIIFFSVSICFAGEEHEFQILDSVLKSINKHFNLSKSPTKIMSNMVLEQERALGKQFTSKEAYSYRNGLILQGKAPETKLVDDIVEFSNLGAVTSTVTPEYAERAKDYFMKFWSLDSICCGEYALYAMNAIVFENRNQTAANKDNKGYVSPFKLVRLVQTQQGTGNHRIILVEGASGTIFVIDPWINKVVNLSPRFSKLSSMSNTKLSARDDEELNHLYHVPAKDGKFYYDALFVGPDTKWEVEEKLSALWCNLAQENTNEMNTWYTYIKDVFGWKYTYSELLPEKEWPAFCYGEEFSRLQFILGQIAKNFDISKSHSKIISNKIIQEEIKKKKQFTTEEAIHFLDLNQLVSDELTDLDFKVNLLGMFAPIVSSKDATLIASKLTRSWHQKTIGSNEYALLILNAIAFDSMNQTLENVNHRSWFKMARLVFTKPKTGDHILVLVEGISGNIYVMDPWINKVVKLPNNFTNLSQLEKELSITIPHVDFYPLSPNDNYMLNNIFPQYKDGMRYYDVVYINHDTKWGVEVDISQIMCNAALVNNNEMKLWYEIFGPVFGWKFPYTSILAQNKRLICPDPGL